VDCDLIEGDSLFSDSSRYILAFDDDVLVFLGHVASGDSVGARVEIGTTLRSNADVRRSSKGQAEEVNGQDIEEGAGVTDAD